MNHHDHANSATSVHPCLRFLRVLDPKPEARFNIECYTDLPKGAEKPKPDKLMSRWAGLTLDEVPRLIPELKHLNDKGAGIFTTVNRCIGQRSIGNVAKIRAVHADVDSATDQQLKTLIKALAPSIVVTSSEPTKLHLYWLLNEAAAREKDAVSKLNRLLAYDYGADKAAIDIARILRLPGFKHMKYRHLGKSPIVKASYTNRLYSLAEVQAAFPPIQPTPTHYKARHDSSEDLSTVETEIIAEMKLRCPELWSGAWDQA